jgi:hypothetical protein
MLKHMIVKRGPRLLEFGPSFSHPYTPKCLVDEFSEASVRGAPCQVKMTFGGKECISG